jgi:hypothetical protein
MLRVKDWLSDMVSDKFHEGDKVRMAGYDVISGRFLGMLGRCALCGSLHGMSVYPDTLKTLVFAHWQDGCEISVPAKMLEKVKE